MIVPGMFVCSSFQISMCMFIVSKALLISSATVIVRAGGAIWLNPAMGLFISIRLYVDRHRFTSSGRLQCSPFTLALRSNRYKRQPASCFNQVFQLRSLKCGISHKAPCECRPQLSRYLICISLSHHLDRMANTHDLCSDHLPILRGLYTTSTSSPALHRTYINPKKAD